MNVVIEKFGERDGQERFVLLNMKTGDVITKRDVSEKTLRKYLKGIGESAKLIDLGFAKARSRFEKKHNESAEQEDDELSDIFSEITLEDEGGSGIH